MDHEWEKSTHFEYQVGKILLINAAIEPLLGKEKALQKKRENFLHLLAD